MFEKPLADLHSGVAAMLTVADSAIALVTTIGQHLKDLLAENGDESSLSEELEAYANQLTDKANALSAAVVANTPAAPSPISAEDGSVGTVGEAAADPAVSVDESTTDEAQVDEPGATVEDPSTLTE